MNISKSKFALLLFCMIAMTCFLRPIQANASAGTVTDYRKITWGLSTGRYYVNGIHAFCAEYHKSWPTVGTEIVSIVPCENEVLRKALYYGYNGPANTLGTDDRAHVLTAIAISDANIGESATGASSKYDTFYWDIVNNPSKYPSPPNNFKAYLAIPSSDNMQKLALYITEKNGYVKGVKSTANASLTDGNDCYSLEGAEYGIYSDISANEGSRVGTFVTDASGNTNTVELAPGTYYVRELKAPKGYAKDAEIIPFTVTSEQTTVLQFTDKPQLHEMNLLLQKVDAKTGLPTPQGSGSLEGAQFTVKYYKGLWEKDIDPAGIDQVPEKTWVFETDEKGAVYMKQEYWISGDSIETSLPLGTITIQETKPSKGYLINTTVFVRQITAEGEAESVKSYEAPVIPEEKISPYKLVIHKTDSYKNLLEGAEFTLYADAECKKEVARGITDSDGKLQFDNLEVEQKYYLKETKAPAGYEIPKEDKNLYEIYSLSSPEDNEYHITIENDVVIDLPKTGSSVTVLIPALGIALCCISIYQKINEKKEKNV